MSEQRSSNNHTHNLTRTVLLFTSLLQVVLFIISATLNFLLKDSYKTIIPFFILIAVILLGIQIFLIDKFFRSIKIIDQSANQMSQGKLNISDILVDKTKGVETLSIAFNDMKRNLLRFIETTKSNVIILSDAIDNVTRSLENNYKGNEQIASNMSTVAEKAQEQLKIAKATLDSMQEVSEMAKNITDTLANIESFVDNTVKISGDGSRNLDHYNQQMKVITTNLDDTNNFVQTLNEHLQEIDQVGGLIISITEQLKLLSLNSSVEAARAGDAGKGFVVVAQEMNKLSTATKDSIVQINKLISNITTSNAKVSESISNVSESFNKSKSIFTNVQESFTTINNNANILSQDMKKVYAQSQKISATTGEISKQGVLLHDSSDEISSITQTVAAVTQEELAENEILGEQAKSLKEMLFNIQGLLHRYKTSVTPVDKISTKKLKLIMMSPLDHPFWEAVRQGVLFAQNELKSKNTEIEYIPFDKIDYTFNVILKEKINTGCDGLILPGFVSGIEEGVNLANQKNIPVMAFNCDFVEGTKRLSYFGPDVVTASILAGKLIAKGMNEEGEVALFTGDSTASICKIRCDGVTSILARYKKIKIVTRIDEIISFDEVYQKTKGLLSDFQELKAIVIVSGGVHGAAKAIEEMGRIGKTAIYCFDYDKEIIEMIKKGSVHTAMGQDPFGQGHDPAIYLYNYLVANEVPENITYTRTEVVDIRSVSE